MNCQMFHRKRFQLSQVFQVPVATSIWHLNEIIPEACSTITPANSKNLGDQPLASRRLKRRKPSQHNLH